jgi:hypothetical protein
MLARPHKIPSRKFFAHKVPTRKLPPQNSNQKLGVEARVFANILTCTNFQHDYNGKRRQGTHLRRGTCPSPRAPPLPRIPPPPRRRGPPGRSPRAAATWAAARSPAPTRRPPRPRPPAPRPRRFSSLGGAARARPRRMPGGGTRAVRRRIGGARRGAARPWMAVGWIDVRSREEGEEAAVRGRWPICEARKRAISVVGLELPLLGAARVLWSVARRYRLLL